MTLARFSKIKALVYAIGWLSFWSWFYYFSTRHPSGISLKNYLEMKHLGLYPAVIVGWFLSIFSVISQLVTLRQIIFRGATAIWLNDKKLCYINPGRMITFQNSVDISDVTSISVRSIGIVRRRAIVLQLRGIVDVPVLTWLFSESAEVILRRMKEAGLTVN